MSSAPNTSTGEQSRWLVLMLAAACGASIANIYYAQPLIGQISQYLGLDLEAAGLIVTTLQIGYGLGLFFLVPLADLVENKRLILIMMGVVIVSLLAATVAPLPSVFIFFSLLVGLTSTTTQVIVPFAVYFAPDHKRGQVVGTVVSGLLFGILLARPLSTLVGGTFGWRTMYCLSAAIMVAAASMLAIWLPKRQPVGGVSYAALIASLWKLLRTEPVLQRRAAYQGVMFAAFTLYWTSMPLLLELPPFSLGHVAIAAVMFSGVVGAFITPFVGRAADRGYSRALTWTSISLVVTGFLIALIGNTSVWMLVAAGILIDAGVQVNLIIGQRAVFGLAPENRSRLNALLLALSFLGGAVGSASSGYAVTHGGVIAMSLFGLVFAAIYMAMFATELRKRV